MTPIAIATTIAPRIAQGRITRELRPSDPLEKATVAVLHATIVRTHDP
jgi:hypothetical protein